MTNTDVIIVALVMITIASVIMNFRLSIENSNLKTLIITAWNIKQEMYELMEDKDDEF